MVAWLNSRSIVQTLAREIMGAATKLKDAIAATGEAQCSLLVPYCRPAGLRWTLGFSGLFWP